MQKIDQAEYSYTIPDSATGSILDFMHDAIAMEIEYYLGDCRKDASSDGDEYFINEQFNKIEKLWQLYEAFKINDFHLENYDKIELLYFVIEFNIFEQIRKQPDVDNPLYFYEILKVWRDLDKIYHEHLNAKSKERRAGVV